MAKNYYTLENVAEHVRNKRLEGFFTDCKVTGLRELDYFESVVLKGNEIAFNLSLKDNKGVYKGQRFRVVTTKDWFSFQDVDFSNEALTEYFDILLGI